MNIMRILILSTALSGATAVAVMAQTEAAKPVQAAKPAEALTDVPSKIAAPVTAPIAPVDETVKRSEFNALVRQALLDNPEILVEAAEKFRDKQDEVSQQKIAGALKANHDALFNDGNAPSIGNMATADVTIVEFFDYHCGYCHQIMPALAKLAQDDKKVRIVFKEFPILSPDSVLAAKAALAVNRVNKDKYFEFHQRLISNQGQFTEIALLKVAKEVGVDEKKVKAEMDKPETSAQLDNIRKIAEELGIRGTPAIIIGDKLFPGAMSYEDMVKEVAKVRALKATKPTN